jgi:putative iron-regulated protein
MDQPALASQSQPKGYDVKQIEVRLILVLLAGLTLYGSHSVAATHRVVLNHYADLAYAMYSDALTTARTLQKAIDQPTESHLKVARAA